MDMKKECSELNLTEVKPEPFLFSDVPIQKNEEEYHLSLLENNYQTQKCKIKNEILDIETNLALVKKEIEINQKYDFIIQENNIKNEIPDSFDLKTINTVFGKDDCVQTHPNKIFKKNKTKFECPVCQKYFSSSKSRFKHFDQHFKNSSIICDFCGRESNGKLQFWNHYTVHFVKNKYKRLGTKSASSRKPLRCKICLKLFTGSLELNKHSKLHIGQKGKINMDSQEIGVRRDIKICLFNHKIWINHNNNFSFQIKNSKDNKEVTATEAYTKHRDPLCRSFRQTSGKKHKCSICEKTFGWKSHLTKHSLTHTGEKNYKCSICEKVFGQKSHLKRHFLIHTGEKNHECSICEKVFGQKSHLTNHLLSHTGEKNYKCSICKKSFTLKSNLTTHLLIHTGEKHHKCSICKKVFTQKSHLTGHLRIHTGEKKYI